LVAAQLFGSRPSVVAEAARRVAEAGFPLVDLNLGCPAPKVRKQQAGAALLGDAVALRQVARAVVAASPVPVTAKMRLGRTASDRAPLAAAKLLAEEGVAALAVHGRTLAQRFSGPVETEAIREIVEAVAVPVWANGGVETPRGAQALREATGAAGVMVGRAAVRRPYLINQIEIYEAEGRETPPPSRAELAEAIRFHFDRAAALDGEERAARQFRKHLLAYFKAARGAKELRPRAARVASRADVEAVLQAWVDLPDDGS
jgi:nifR3 family TIM-barrel protein